MSDAESTEQSGLTLKKDRPVLATAVFAGGTAFPRALSLLMLPVYTAALSPAEYGDLSILLLIGIAISQILPLGLDLALFRNYFLPGFEGSARTSYINSIWLLVAVSAVIGGIAFAGFGIALLGPSGNPRSSDYAVAVLAYALYAVAAPIPLALLRAEQRLRSFAILTLASAVVTTGFIVIAVTGLDGGVSGWLWATAAANAVMLVLAATIIPFRKPVTLDRVRLGTSVRLGVAIVPHYLSHWALLGANRLVLASVVSSTAVGIFSLAANMALPAHIIGQALNQALTPRYARAISEADAASGLPRIMITQAATVVGACTALALLLPPLVPVFLPPSYGGAAALISWLLLAYGLLGLYYIPMSVVTVLLGHAKWTWIFPVGSAGGSLVLLALVADESDLGPAAATVALGYLVLLIGVGGYATRVASATNHRGIIPWATIAAISAAGGLVYGLGTQVAGAATLSDLLLRCLYVGVFATGLAIWTRRRSGVLPRTATEERL